MALHQYLARVGFVLPMQSEIDPGLVTLGQTSGGTDLSNVLERLLNDASGGLLSAVGLGPSSATSASEPSGSDRDRERYPRGVVTDPPSVVSTLINMALQGSFSPEPACGSEAPPSEFAHPWRFPETNNSGAAVPTELEIGRASAYVSGDDARRLVGVEKGDPNARVDFEAATKVGDTLAAIDKYLSSGATLGSPIDYAGYVIARLTRDNPEPIANFNLDSDRIYGALCWDWKRDHDILGTPAAYGGPATVRVPHSYQAPVAPGYGWCEQELNTSPPPPPVASPSRPRVAKASEAVAIRYIDKEDAFR
jgi:hypothetical protein